MLRQTLHQRSPCVRDLLQLTKVAAATASRWLLQFELSSRTPTGLSKRGTTIELYGNRNGKRQKLKRKRKRQKFKRISIDGMNLLLFLFTNSPCFSISPNHFQMHQRCKREADPNSA